ncbi:MAG: hypothetical protein NUK65_09955 [Firmicutes bacterium]|nr:hypothetical protein [Bacillota bacterium]
MPNKPLKELLLELEQELLRLGYSKGSMTFYRRRWAQILQFAEEQGKVCYTEQVGIDFLEDRFRIFKKDFDKTLSQKDTQELRIIRMIGDFQLHHTILRRYYKHRKLLTDPYYLDISAHFKKYCEGRDYSPVTVGHSIIER